MGSPAVSCSTKRLRAFTMPGLFFHAGAAAAGAADAAVVLGRLLQLRQAQPDGVAAEAGEPAEMANAAAAVLASQEADEQPAGFLVQGGDQPVDIPVLLGKVALGLLLTG